MNEKRNAYNIFSWKTWREKIVLGDVGVDGKITLKWILKKLGADCIQLAQDRVHWRLF
jgi:hypothetical protein